MPDDYAVASPHGWLSVTDAIFHNARRRPLHPAIIDRGRVLNYAALAVVIRNTAAHLGTLAVQPGDIVGFCLADNSESFVRPRSVSAAGGA